MTKDEAIVIYQAGQKSAVAVILKLATENELLTERLQQLENQLAKDSHNSSKPPSSDGFNKQKTQSLRRSTSRQTGGQKGHPGQTLKKVDKPNHVIVHRVTGDCCCGASLTNQQVDDYEARQVFDLPPIIIEVTEHRAEIKTCACCGRRHKAQFPEAVTKVTQYGNRVKALAIYLMNYQFIPYERTQEFFNDIFFLPISQGTLLNFNKSCYHLLEATSNLIKEQIKQSDVVHFDESGLYVTAIRHWLHSHSTEDFTYYDYHKQRGTKAMQDIGILPDFKGTAVHDHWKSYFTYPCKHGLCNSHHLRELKYISEQYQQSWAQDMISLLCEIKNKVEIEKAYRYRLDEKILHEYEKRYGEILIEGEKANPPPPINNKNKKRGKPKQSEPKNLLDRLKHFSTATLAFMYDFNVPFDNNLAERDVRMIKVQQKISGTFRSELGAKYFCRIRGFISTARKQKLKVLSSIFDALSNVPVFTFKY
jgi:transposase